MFSLISRSLTIGFLSRHRGAQYTALPLAGMAAAYRDAMQPRKLSIEPPPDPSRDVLERWCFKTGDVVEILVIERILHELDGGREGGKARCPAEFGVRFAAHQDFDDKRVTVQVRVGWS